MSRHESGSSSDSLHANCGKERPASATNEKPSLPLGLDNFKIGQQQLERTASTKRGSTGIEHALPLFFSFCLSWSVHAAASNFLTRRLDCKLWLILLQPNSDCSLRAPTAIAAVDKKVGQHCNAVSPMNCFHAVGCPRQQPDPPTYIHLAVFRSLGACCSVAPQPLPTGLQNPNDMHCCGVRECLVTS